MTNVTDSAPTPGANDEDHEDLLKWIKQAKDNEVEQPATGAEAEQVEKPKKQRAPATGASRQLAKERARRARAALKEARAGAGGAEEILDQLAADDLELVILLWTASLRVAARLDLLCDSPSSMLAMARALRETTKVGDSLQRRIREALMASSALRAQRTMVRDFGASS